MYEERIVSKNMALLDAQISSKGIKSRNIFGDRYLYRSRAKPRENAVLRDLLSDTFLVIIGICRMKKERM